LSPAEQTLRCEQKKDNDDDDETQELTDGAGWISGPRKIAAEQCHPVPKTDESVEAAAMRHQMNGLQAEINRLMIFEAECVRKDDLIEQLREEITNLQNFVRLIEVDRCPFCQKETLSGSARLLQLGPTNDAEPVFISEIDAPSSRQVNNEESSVSELSSRVLTPVKSSNINDLHAELDRARDDCNLSISLACQMQRDMINKDITISRMAQEIDKLTQTVLDRDMHITALEENIQRLDGGQMLEETDILAKDREIALLRYKLSHADTNKAERQAQLSSVTNELSQCKSALDVFKQSEKKLKNEMEAMKVKHQDLERAERASRIDVETLSKRFERLRSRAVQTTFAGTKVPDKLISDDELLSMMKKCADDRGGDAQKKTPETPVKESKKK